MLSIGSLLACVVAVAAGPNPALGVLVATGTSSSVRPNPSQVYINSISYGGTGCPQGSVGSFISDNRQTFTLIFDSYVASIGPTVAATENRKNCQLNLDLQYPSGQYSIFTTQFRGYAVLDKGVQGTQKATYYFSGQPEQASSSTVFNGPISTDYATGCQKHRDVAINGVICEETGRASNTASQTDLGVDVKWESLSTRRPDGGGEWDTIRNRLA
ncbi:hypothetical protein VC83_02450 [Pseudogymnoascus destructans]|uniref:Secreted protein n=2 Tax=Pseudogymnoascus destructans TaxID=655981 RepID=L8G4R9_PSED2|nr:uncharacterized protein VC83_02450 [Pseudogymnoascus destructans]ELR07643.1 hypothetical protein GMDG_08498 [Pseudogymnoascus destructans 20631-21]OAF61235.1 hypothetical protein VC83_02450 [Pseudogymnoascus destructans]